MDEPKDNENSVIALEDEKLPITNNFEGIWLPWFKYRHQHCVFFENGISKIIFLRRIPVLLHSLHDKWSNPLFFKNFLHEW